MGEAEEVQEDLPQLHLGEVCTTNIAKGFSWIRCPDADYDSDVFVHRSVVDPSTWTTGEQVACSVEIGPKGKPQACAPVWRLQGQFKAGQVPELGEFVGEVGEVTEAGNSTVDCEDVLEAYGKQAFLHRNVIEQCGLAPGDVIGFTVHVSASGCPQVSAPCWRDCSQNQGARHPGPPAHHSSGSSATAYVPRQERTSIGSAVERRGRANFKSELCRHFQNGHCDKGDHCTFAHGDDQLAEGQPSLGHPQPGGRPSFKSAICKYFQNGHCDKGDRCTYAHGEHELAEAADPQFLKAAPDGHREAEAIAQSATAPRARFKAVLCRHFENGKCEKGERCTFAHGDQELQGPGSFSAPSEEDLRQFIEANGIDYKAAEFLSNSTPEVQAEILSSANFDNAKNPSAVLMKLIRAVSSEQPKFSDAPTSVQWVSLQDIQQFVEVNGIDQPAAEFLVNSTKEVQVEVLERANFEGAHNPSALLTKLIKTVAQEQRDGGWRAPPAESTKRWHGSDQPLAKVAKTSAAWNSTGGFYFGTVTLVDPTKGYSLVDCPDSGYDRHVYVKSLVAPPTKAIDMGDTVAFRIRDVDGNPQAMAPLFRLIGAEANEMPPDIGAHVGRLARVSQDGCGFVESDTVHKAYERDAWVATAVMDKCSIELGDTIAFKVSEGKKGFPQVQAPCWKCCSVEGLESIRGTMLAMASASEEGDGRDSEGAQRRGTDRNHYYVGRVRQVDLSRESSKIHCPDAGYNCDVHCHKNTADPALLQIDNYVAFPLHVSAKGMPQASSPLWKLAGIVKDDADVVFGEWIGKLKETTQAGITFVECPELQMECGREAFIHQSVIDQCGLTPAETIAFSLHFNARGHPQVQAPCWRFCSEPHFAPWPGRVVRQGNACAPPVPKPPDAPAGKGKRKHGNEPATAAATEVHVPHIVAPPPKATPGKGKAKGGKGKVKGKGQGNELEKKGLDGSYAVGWVKKIDQARDFYVVDVPDAGLNAHHITGRGVIVNFSVAHGLAVDDAVFFQLHTNHRGETKASKQFPVWKLIGHSPTGTVPEIGQFVGKVKELNMKGTHYVLCPEAKEYWNNEPFVPNEAIEELGLVAGDTICFDVHLTAKGSPVATSPCWKNMSPYEPKPFQSGAQREERLAKRTLDAPEPEREAKAAKTEGVHAVGWVKLTDIEKGYSMVEVPNSGYDRDVWVSRAIAEPKLLTVEDTVFFQIHVNNRGLPQAAAPVWKLVGMVPREGNVSFIGNYKGKVKDINEDGTAHVDCPDVAVEHGTEAYLDCEVLQETGVRPGDIIFFDISGTNVGAMPQVSSPLWKSCSDEKWTPIGRSAGRVSLEAPCTPPSEEPTFSHQPTLPMDTGGEENGAGQREEDGRLQDCKPERGEDLFQNDALGQNYERVGQQLHSGDDGSQGFPRNQDLPPPAQWPGRASPPRDPRQARPIHQHPPPPLPHTHASPQLFPNPMAVPASVPDDTPLREGEQAEIYGLNTEAGRQLNNLRVTVIKVDKNTGRVQVRFAPDAQRPQDVRLKAANLRRAIS